MTVDLSKLMSPEMLARIRQAKPGETVVFSDLEMGGSLSDALQMVEQFRREEQWIDPMEHRRLIKQHKLDDMYMDIAFRTAAMSHARRTSEGGVRGTGAVIVFPNGMLSQGWNGMPAGMDNNCEHEPDNWDGDIQKLVTKEDVRHAEDNALDKVLQSTMSTTGATIYTTMSPCMRCAPRIHGAGIVRVVYGERYRDETAIRWLRDRGLKVSQHFK